LPRAVAHVIGLVVGIAAFFGTIVTGKLLFVAVSGGALAIAGVTAVVSGHSLVMPKGMNYVIDAEGDPEGTRKLRRGGARLMGTLLTIFGLAALVAGLWFHARGFG
jgi:hypothetical protein